MKEMIQVQASYNEIGEQLPGTWDDLLDSFTFKWTNGLTLEECVSDDMAVLHPFIQFNIAPINITNDCESYLYRSVMDYDFTILTADDDGVLEQIKRIADQRRHDDCSKFILVYDISFHCYCDGWYCDCEEEITLLGSLDIDNLPILPLPKVTP